MLSVYTVVGSGLTWAEAGDSADQQMSDFIEELDIQPLSYSTQILIGQAPPRDSAVDSLPYHVAITVTYREERKPRK